MRKFLFLVLVCIAPSMLKAQTFSRKDSLRGTLTDLRSCFDVHFYNLMVDVDFEKQSLEGEVEIYLEAKQSFDKIQLDLYANMDILEINYAGQPLFFEREFDAVFVHFTKAIPAGAHIMLSVQYFGTPQKAVKPPWDGGFAWKKDEKGNDWLGVAVEGDGASLWWPNKDHLSDEPDSMAIRVTVPDTLICVSNGVLRSELAVKGNKKQYNWFVSYPINNYNVTLNIGKYVHFSDTYVSQGTTYPLDYYVMPYNLEKAKEQFQQVHGMMDCFEGLFGPYPFWNDGYALVETPYLGMEHQGAIAYGNGYMPGYKGRRPLGIDFDYIIIHETGHEWWGNSVSMNDIADMWIHESFCTYSEALFVECSMSTEEMVRYLNYQRAFISNTNPVQGPYGVNRSGDHTDMYYKGSWMLHTLRSVIDNDEKWLAIIKGLAMDFKHSNVDGADIINYIEKEADLELSYFFDQYQKQSKLPELRYNFSKKWFKHELSYKWISEVEDFRMPVRVAINNGEMQWIYPTADWQTIKLKRVKFPKIKVDLDHFLVNSLELKELR
ncbi:MAG: aminopeptidase N [Candidatus Azotimanducaceae bacterium]|jgi:aminopeptidase N